MNLNKFTTAAVEQALSAGAGVAGFITGNIVSKNIPVSGLANALIITAGGMVVGAIVSDMKGNWTKYVVDAAKGMTSLGVLKALNTLAGATIDTGVKGIALNGLPEPVRKALSIVPNISGASLGYIPMNAYNFQHQAMNGLRGVMMPQLASTNLEALVA